MDVEEDYESDDTDDEVQQNTVEKPNTNQSIGDGFDATSHTGSVKVTFSNYPTLCEVFVDPVTLNQKVILVLSLPSGAKNTKIELSDSNHKVCLV